MYIFRIKSLWKFKVHDFSKYIHKTWILNSCYSKGFFLKPENAIT